MQTWFWLAVVVASIGLLVGLGWLGHRLCIRLEEAGYLYYREESSGSAGAGILGEIDKLVRPNIEHTIELRETTHVEEDGIDGD